MDEENQIEVTYKFYLPEHEEDLEEFKNASKYRRALCDIYNRCRTVWKYEDDAPKERVDLAEEISAIASIFE